MDNAPNPELEKIEKIEAYKQYFEMIVELSRAWYKIVKASIDVEHFNKQELEAAIDEWNKKRGSYLTQGRNVLDRNIERVFRPSQVTDMHERFGLTAADIKFQLPDDLLELQSDPVMEDAVIVSLYRARPLPKLDLSNFDLKFDAEFLRIPGGKAVNSRFIGRLSAADFTEADLQNANFSDTTHIGGKFVNANLQGTNFRGTCFHTDFDLRGADIRNADFTDSNISEVFPSKFKGVGFNGKTKGIYPGELTERGAIFKYDDE
ncbi:MAG: pentapeptide repeat-containing protein [Candidatus Magasanikbacteria bacterium]